MYRKINIYVDTVDFEHFVIQKSVSRKIMHLDIEEMIFAVKSILLLLCEIDSDGINTAVALMNQDIMVKL